MVTIFTFMRKNGKGRTRISGKTNELLVAAIGTAASIIENVSCDFGGDVLTVNKLFQLELDRLLEERHGKPASEEEDHGGH